MRKVQAADMGSFQGAGLGAAVPGLAGDAAGRDLARAYNLRNTALSPHTA